MPVPKYYEFQKPFLTFIQDGQPYSKKDIQAYLRQHFHLSQADISELLPSGRQTVFANRVAWASTYLKKAGLIVTTSRAVYQITSLGKQVLADNPSVIDDKYLERFDAFRSFQGMMQTSTSNTGIRANTIDDINQTPDDILENAIQKINASLADDLMAEIMKISPTAFERMVLDLMRKMGYGRFDSSVQTTAISGDEGIDGIIMQDKLGFDLIYVQAKQWGVNQTVGRPDIQAFVGAISGRGGNGLFVTTSKFSKQAVAYASAQHIILIDGEKLTDLMIEYGFGVSTQKTFEIKTLDSDVFFAYQDES